MRLSTILLALLLMALFMPAAGAIYIPGQETPDDGLYHIMSGEDAVPAYQGIPYSTALLSQLPFNYGISAYPILEMPQIYENVGTGMRDIIGHIVTPSIQGFWEGIRLDSLNVNMPMI